MTKIYEFIKPWILPAVGIIGVMMLVGAWNNARSARNALAAELDRERLHAAGVAAASEVTRKELAHTVEEMTQRSTILAAEVARLRAAVPGTTPLVAATGTTGWVPVFPVPPGTSGAGQAGSAPTAGGTCPPCALHPGDMVEVRADLVAERAPSGAVGVVGVVGVWGKDFQLAEAPLKLDVRLLETPNAPGWGGGAIVVGGRDGWWLGPMIAPPPLRAWGVEINTLVAAGVGGGGAWGGAVGTYARW